MRYTNIFAYKLGITVRQYIAIRISHKPIKCMDFNLPSLQY